MHKNYAIILACENGFVSLAALQKRKFSATTHSRNTLMAALDTTRAHASHAGLGSLAARVLSMLTAWNERRATRNALSQLSDRELDDIGLTRGDIDVVARSL